MSVAEPMGWGRPRAVQIAVRLEAVVDDDATFEAFRHFAALVADAVERQGLGGRRMQPSRLGADAKAGLVEAAYARGPRTSAPIRSATGASAAARRRDHCATLAAQRLFAPIRSASASAVRSSGIRCCTWR